MFYTCSYHKENIWKVQLMWKFIHLNCNNLTQMTIISTTVGKNPLEEKEGLVALITNKRVWCSTWMQSQKWQNDLCSFPRQTIQYHSNPSLCHNQQCWRSWSWTVLWRPTRPSRTNIQKRCPLHYRGLEYNSRQSRDTGVTSKFDLGVQNEAEKG